VALAVAAGSGFCAFPSLQRSEFRRVVRFASTSALEPASFEMTTFRQMLIHSRHFGTAFSVPRVYVPCFESTQLTHVWAATCQLNRMKHFFSGMLCRWHGAGAQLIALITLFFPATLNAATLEPATLKAWEQYTEAANVRMEKRLSPGKTFLWVDEDPDRLARVRAGEIVVSPAGPQNPKKVPSGLIHHWVGAAFIANTTLNDVLRVVTDYARYKEFYQPTVIESKVIAKSESKDQFSMLLMNKSLFSKTALDTDYETCYVHVDDRRGYSIARATRIQQVEEYGAPAQRVLPEGDGNGLIWRLFSITR